MLFMQGLNTSTGYNNKTGKFEDDNIDLRPSLGTNYFNIFDGRYSLDTIINIAHEHHTKSGNKYGFCIYRGNISDTNLTPVYTYINDDYKHIKQNLNY